MYNYKLCDYVPEPKPVSSPYTIACHYYPGWKRGGADIHNGFEDLKPYPERTPLLGYYDEADPMSADWQIKWAVEHGVNCFIYCWYRYPENLGKPVTREALRFGHAIHDALFHARYRDFMQFAIMWECSNERWGTAANIADMTDNLLTFWVDNYFSKPNYLTIDGKPVLYIYNVRCLIADLGGEDVLAEAIVRCNERIQAMGYPGIHFSFMSNGWSKKNIEHFDSCGTWGFEEAEELMKLGFDSAFQYNWHFYGKVLTDKQIADYEKTLRVPDEIVVKYQLEMMELFAKKHPEFYTLTASVMWDRSPWVKVFNLPPVNKILPNFKLDPESWKILLTGMRNIIDQLPDSSIGKKIIMLDNWNEWSEGHFICPNAGYGFAHLQAVREVFTNCDNLPDYRLPETLGLPEC